MFDYKPYIVSLSKFMAENGYTVRPFPKIILSKKKQEGVFISTGYYDPEERTITVFINDRHPKDVLRSVAHELIHHKQTEEGLLTPEISRTEQKLENSVIRPFEEEAYLNGNIAFRMWTESFEQ